MNESRLHPKPIESIKPLSKRRVFHLTKDTDAFLANADSLLVLINDYERILLKIDKLKLVIAEGLFLHLVTSRKHIVVVFNKNINHLIKHPSISTKLGSLDAFYQDYE